MCVCVCVYNMYLYKQDLAWNNKDWYVIKQNQTKLIFILKAMVKRDNSDTIFKKLKLNIIFICFFN